MKKRVEFEATSHQACEDWLNEFRKFKVFKEELMSVLNIRERQLNDLCRKIRRTIPYEKDRQFNDPLADTINDCNRALHKLRINRSEIPLLLKKEHQICTVIK